MSIFTFARTHVHRFLALALGICALPAALAQQPVITRAPLISTIAGNGSAANLGDGGTALNASFDGPFRVAVGTTGDLFVVERQGCVRRIAVGSTVVSTYAGNCSGGSELIDGQHATSGSLAFPDDIAIDTGGNLYIVENKNYKIRKVTPGGVISTVAGTGSSTPSGNGGFATNAGLGLVDGIAVDSAGNLYLGTLGSIRKVATNGIITNFAGTGTQGFSGDGGLATSAQLVEAVGLTVDGLGNVIFADTQNQRVRKVNTAGYISTVAGGGVGGDGSQATAASLSYPEDVSVDPGGNLYIVENSTRVRIVSGSNGTIQTYAGITTTGFSGDGGSSEHAQLSYPEGVALDPAGNLYIADTNNNRIREVQVAAGNFQLPSTQVGSTSAQSVMLLQINSALFLESISAAPSQEYAVASVTGCNVGGGYVPSNTVCTVSLTFSPGVAGPRNVPLQVVTTAGTFSFGLTGIGLGAQVAYAPAIIGTAAGTGTAGATGDGGQASTATLNQPYGIAVDAMYNQYIYDTANYRIRKVTASTGIISTIAGTGINGGLGNGGPAIAAQITTGYTVAVDAGGDVYFAETGSSRIRRIDAGTGILSTVAGSDGTGFSGDGGPANRSFLNAPQGVAVDSIGNIYIADTFNHRVRKISAINGGISTIAGNGVDGSTGDGGPATSAELHTPVGVAVDANGNVYVADNGTAARIRRIDGTSGIISTIVGNGTIGYNGDEILGTNAEINNPEDPAVDAAGNVYFSDSGNARIRKVDIGTGIIHTLAGTGTSGSTGDGGVATKGQIVDPYSIALDSIGNVYIADPGAARIRKVNSSISPSLTFATTNVGATSVDSPQDVNFANIGNETLIIPHTASGYDPTLSANFSVVRNLQPTCNSALPDIQTGINVGTSCNYIISFQPTVSGPISGQLVLTDNAIGGTQVIDLYGTGTDSLASFRITGLVNATAGSTETITLTALDPAGNVDTGYRGTVHFDASDLQATKPQDYTFTAADNGSRTFSFFLRTAGYSTVYATDTATGIQGSESATITAGAPASITPTSGINQSTVVNTAYGAPFVVQVKDAYGNPVPNLFIAFSWPQTTTAPSGSYTTTNNYTAADGTNNVTGTANTKAGSYTLSATVQGTGLTTSFTVTNTPGAAASITATSGNNQSAVVNTAYGAPFVVTVKDAYGNPVPNLFIAFSWPQTATAPSGSYTTTNNYTAADGTNNVTGTANTKAGSYTLSATVQGTSLTTSFTVTNTAGAPASIAVTSGNNQSAVIGTAFASAIVFTVSDAYGNTVPNFFVTFAGPASGASVYLSAGAVYTDGSGHATVTGTADGIAGTFSLTATANGHSTAFTLTNLKATPSLSVAPSSTSLTYGQPVTINASLTPTVTSGAAPYGAVPPAGSITFYDGAVPLTPAQAVSSAAASFTVAQPTVGTHQYYAQYTGDNNFNPTALTAASSTVVVGKASATVTLGSLSATYDGTPKAATATTSPAGLAVSFTYNGSATAPSAAGSYTVVGTVSDPNYMGSATGTLVIAKAAATVTLGNLAANYDGTAHAATATTSPAGLSVSFTYNGASTAPTAAGSYTVVGTVSDPNYAGSATGTLVIGKSSATVTLGSLSATYTGTAHAATATTSPAGLSVSFTYNGVATAPTAAGSYAVVATVSDPNYSGAATGTLVIGKATATVTLGSLSVTYTGAAQAATATTSPAGLSVSFTYNGSATAPSAVGNYTVVGTISDPNYSGSATGTLVISKGSATVTLGSLSATFDGNPHAATATTTPAGLSVSFTYNGSATAPSAAGSYAVVGTINDPNYSGSATGTLTIGKGVATVTLGSLAATYNGSPHAATATTTPAGLSVSFTYNGSATAPTAPGSYTVVGTVTDANYTGSATGTLTIGKAAGSVTLANLSANYDGNPHAATASTTPAGLAVTLTYDGAAAAPTAAGSYTVVATISDTNYSGSTTGTLIIAKGSASVTLGSLTATYDGNAHAATATTSPSGLTVTFTYNGSASAPTAAGSYTVVGTISDANYTGSATGTLTIGMATATVTLGSLTATYDGNPHAATASTTPSGLTVNLTYNGSATAPTAVGSYAVVATVSDANYTGSASGTLTIGKGSATVTLGGLATTYNGSAHSATATATPAGLTVTLTYNGSSTSPTAAGSYTVVGTINDARYSGSASGTLVIAKAAATVTLGSLSTTYDGTAHAATANTTPSGLAVNLTYNGAATAPSAVGSYTVVGTVSDANYTGSATGTLTIGQGSASVLLGSLSATYDGTPHPATATTTPAGLAVSLTYNGSATAPTAIGSYTVVGTVNDPNYTGSATGTLTISAHTATVTLGGLSATYDGNPHAATATTNPAGLTVNITYNGAATVPTAAGSYAVAATVADLNYNGSASGTLVIAKATASITLGALNATYDGTAHAATVTTSPAGLAVTLTYNGSATAPTAVGSYAVSAKINDPNYTGSATGTLTIGQGTATVTLGNLSATYDGSAHAATATTNPAGLTVNFTYNGSSSAPTAAGSYPVVGTISDTNYTGSGTGTLVIAKAPAAVTLSNLSASYDGNPHAATATTNPAGLAVSLTYNGSATAPTASGSYAVVGTVTDPNYSGSATGTLTIGSGNAMVTLGSLSASYDGNPHAATATTTPVGLAVTFTYNGTATVPTAAGSYAVIATINDPHYNGSASGTLVIAKATASVTLGNLSAVYDGNPHAATASTTPAGLGVTLTYNGSATAPSATGSYTVVATVNDSNYSGSTTGTLTISGGSATVTLGSLAATYDGTPHAATATTNPAGLPVTFTYNGSATVPVAAGSYAVVGSVNTASYSGSASGTLVISKAAAMATVSNVSVLYDGNPHAATATTTPAGLAVSLTYNGAATAPSAVGTYAVVATITDPNYTGSGSGTLTIGSGNATVTLASLAATYDGTAHAATATTNPVGLAVTFTYNGSATVPTAAGSYTVVSTINDPHYSGSASGTLVIAKATAGVTLGSLTATYDGTAHAATAATTPAGLAVALSYNGAAAAPTAAGSYTVVATVNDPNYTGSTTATLIIAPATVGVTLGNLSAVYDGNPHAASVTTTPAGLAVNVTYNGAVNVPSAVGSYTVVATVTDPNDTGSATGTLTISAGNATVSLSNLAATYDGNPHSAVATTNPAGLPVTLTYGGSSTAPTAGGSYAVVATINDPHYSGSVTGTLVIGKATATITLGNLAVTYNGNGQAATATTSPAGVAVALTYNGAATLPVATGSYAVAATVTDPNYNGSAAGTLVISKANAAITLSNLTAMYDGTAHAATAVTSPAGLAVALTYNGSAAAPTAVGSYLVAATVTDANYTGTASGTLTISMSTASVTLGSLTATYDGAAHAATAVTSPAGLGVSFTYNGSAAVPVAAGTYAVAATITDPRYRGMASGTLVIAKAVASVTLSNLNVAYDGTAHAASVTTSPAGLSVALTYNGAAAPPSAAGSYAVSATVNDANYTGSAAGTLVIGKAAAAIVLGNLNAVFDGATHAASVVTTPANLASTVTYNGQAAFPLTAGSYAVAAVLTDPDYSAATSATLTIARAPTSLQLATSATAVNAGQSVTLTATVGANASVLPTGQVSYFDNGSSLGSFALTNGVASAQFLLAAGTTHSITASYGGDTNFLPSTGSGAGVSISVSRLSFTLTNSSATEVDVPLGTNTVSYTFALAPLPNSIYPGTVTFAVTGIPDGARYSLTPAQVEATAGPQTVTLTVQTFNNVVQNRPAFPNRTLPVYALLMLPLLLRRRLRGRWKSALPAVLLLAGSFGVMTTLSGCGSGVQGGFVHNMSVTASSGGQQQVATVVLKLQ